MKFLVTGGAGFIGSAVVRYLMDATEAEVVNVDKLTYAADRRSLERISNSRRYSFEQHDIADRSAMAELFRRYRPDIVMNLAAETHVDRSIDGPADFVRTNIVGTFTLLEAALDYWRGLDSAGRLGFRFHHVSTDEVFGMLGDSGQFSEDSPYRPNSPYAASKASSDHLVRAWHHTFGLPTIISNCTNNYGPYQFPEKLIPLMIINALKGKPLPVYGRGANVRDWLHVEDHARALHRIATAGTPGRSYNVGGLSERSNLEVVQAICGHIDVLQGRAAGTTAEQIEFVTDRPGHDFRYAIDARRIERELGFTPATDFAAGLKRTVEWYCANEAWWAPLLAQRYGGGRLGLGRAGG